MRCGLRDLLLKLPELILSQGIQTVVVRLVVLSLIPNRWQLPLRVLDLATEDLHLIFLVLDGLGSRYGLEFCGLAFLKLKF